MHHPILVYGLTGYGIFVAAALYLWQRLYLGNISVGELSVRTARRDFPHTAHRSLHTDTARGRLAPRKFDYESWWRRKS